MPYCMSIKRGILWTDVLKKEYYKKPIFYQIHFRHLRRVLFAVVFFNPFIPINRAEVIQYNKQLYLIQHTWARFEKLRRRFARTWFFSLDSFFNGKRPTPLLLENLDYSGYIWERQRSYFKVFSFANTLTPFVAHVVLRSCAGPASYIIRLSTLPHRSANAT